MSALYELTGQYIDLLDAIESGEIPEEAISDTLEALGGELDEKIDSCACIVKQLDSEATAIKAEKAMLAGRQSVKEHQRDRLKDYIRQAMGLAGKKKVETSRNCVSVKKAQPKAVITDLDALRSCKSVWKPYDYSKETNVDKTKLKALLQNDKNVTGAELQDGTPRLTIK
ncbi:MAG: siphovirus Gp157 family protein [Oscillospiraceae bacterium]|nr:siphovirus Gp157 family protein [Oscillospiraceae bacterium]